jgi:hypothetical protein
MLLILLIWIFGSVSIFIASCTNKKIYAFIDEYPFGEGCEGLWIVLWPGAVLFTFVFLLAIGLPELLRKYHEKDTLQER